ncbi:hypothetical protein Q5752_001358 [Cryptotrichosporon argae]
MLLDCVTPDGPCAALGIVRDLSGPDSQVCAAAPLRFESCEVASDGGSTVYVFKQPGTPYCCKVAGTVSETLVGFNGRDAARPTLEHFGQATREQVRTYEFALDPGSTASQLGQAMSKVSSASDLLKWLCE